MTAQAAAQLLETNPTTLSLWEQRFGYPVAVRSADGQRLYPDEAMIALRDALHRELSIASAITKARRVQLRAITPPRRFSASKPVEETL
jgi:DNA-binding transcriptional MerR regulator